VLIRSARPDEYERIGELTVRVYLAEGYTRAGSHYLGVLADVAGRAEKAEVVVAVDETDRILGTVTYAGYGSPYAETATAPDEAGFRMLVVDPATRGQGVGDALVRWCIERARQDGARVLRLSTQAGMAAAARLYARLGFVRTPDLDWTPEPDVDLLTYEKVIPAGR
jgi:ribosomal protein S18 acetylase RimI-like enzyme